MVAIDYRKIDINIILEFLEPYEKQCVQLCAAIKKRQEGIFVLSTSLHCTEKNKILGIIHTGSTILHCLPFLKIGDINLCKSFDKIFLKFAAENKVYCVNGEEVGTEYLSALLETTDLRAFQKNNYFLMTKKDLKKIPDTKKILQCDEKIICCTETHLDDLFDLQMRYLCDEVSPKGKIPSEPHCRIILKDILKNQKIFAIECDGEFVAKANTNAIGWNWVQIGGVYTNPLYRRNGYALCLVSELAKKIISANKSACLFVRKKNEAAISLYQKLGFKKEIDFEIAYFA